MADSSFVLRSGPCEVRYDPEMGDSMVVIRHERTPAYGIGTRLAGGSDLGVLKAGSVESIEPADTSLRSGVFLRSRCAWARLEATLNTFHEHPGLLHWRVTATVTQARVFDRKGWDGAECELLTSGRPVARAVSRYFVPRGPATGMLFFFDHGMKKNVLYLQDYTALAGLYEATRYANPFSIEDPLHPSAVRMGSPPVEFQHASVDGTPRPPLPWTETIEEHAAFGYHRPAGVRLEPGDVVVLSDAYLYIHGDHAPRPAGFCRTFVEMLAVVYRFIQKPSLERTDWSGQVAPRMIEGIVREDANWGEHEGRRFLRAYVRSAGRQGAGMELITLTELLVPLGPYVERFPADRNAAELKRVLEAGLPAYWNEEWGCFFNSLSKPKLVSGWYFFWNVLNLCDLALAGNADAVRMVLASRPRLYDLGERLGYTFAMFDPDTYEQQHIYNFEVAGVYVYIMTAIHELTGGGDPACIHHAQGAAARLSDRGFDLTYELNGVAAGAVGSYRLYRITGRSEYLDLCYVPLANVLRWAVLWGCGYGSGRHAVTFWAFCPTPGNHNLAEHESHHARRFLRKFCSLAGDLLSPSVLGLLRDSWLMGQGQSRYAIPPLLAEAGGTWTMVEEGPDATLCGEIDHGSYVPLEDVHVGWCTDDQWHHPNPKNGVVGQEIYGAGGPLWYALWEDDA